MCARKHERKRAVLSDSRVSAQRVCGCLFSIDILPKCPQKMDFLLLTAYSGYESLSRDKSTAQFCIAVSVTMAARSGKKAAVFSSYVCLLKRYLMYSSSVSVVGECSSVAAEAAEESVSQPWRVLPLGQVSQHRAVPE